MKNLMLIIILIFSFNTYAGPDDIESDYGDRSGGMAVFSESEKQQGDHPIKEGEQRPQPGTTDPMPGQMQGRYNLLNYILGCSGLFTNFAAVDFR